MPVSAELKGIERNIKTGWRRGWDSNPRDPFGPNGFQDRRFQPLTHPSGIFQFSWQILAFQPRRARHVHSWTNPVQLLVCYCSRSVIFSVLPRDPAETVFFGC